MNQPPGRLNLSNAVDGAVVFTVIVVEALGEALVTVTEVGTNEQVL
jgi:hypothetical protein